jgi:carboxymethylenebutenolidase
MIELQSDGTMPAYVAEPDGKPKGGVVVVQEIFGVSQPMKNAADLLATQGYLAIVPALFHRVDPHFTAEYNEAGFGAGIAAASKTTLPDLTADLTASTTYLRERLGPDAKLAIWGFCFGGSVAYYAATLPIFDASIGFYGGAIARKTFPDVPALIDFTDKIDKPILLAFGGKDEHITKTDTDAIEAALAKAGKDYIFHVYPDADHGFFRPGPESSPSASDAWERVQAFLAKTLN